MRDFIDIVSNKARLDEDQERSTRTRTRERPTIDINLGNPAAEQPLATTGGTERAPSKRQTSRRGPSRVTGGSASNADAAAIIGDAAERIRQRIRGRTINLPDAADEISNAEAMRRRGIEADMPALPGMATPPRLGRDQARLAGPAGTAMVPMDGEAEPRTVESLPAVVRTELAELGEREMNIKWLQIKQLPGYILQGIRAVGRQVFRQFTHDFPLEEIQTINTITHPEDQVRHMFEVIGRNGRMLDEHEMDFSNIMPGLRAQIKHFSWAGFEWLCMRDMGGYYVYGWPANTRDRIAPEPDGDDDFAPPRLDSPMRRLR